MLQAVGSFGSSESHQEAQGEIDRGWQDKARFLAAGTSFLSFCMHIVFAPLGFDAARCGDGASDAISFVFNGPSAIACNVLSRKKLREDPLSLTDVAAECGFCDQAHFTRMFNRIVVVSSGA